MLPLRTRPASVLFFLPLLLAAIPGTAGAERPPAAGARAAEAIDGVLTTLHAGIVGVADGIVTLDAGANLGLRRWERVTLIDDHGRATAGRLSGIAQETAAFTPETGVTNLPSTGSRVALRRLADRTVRLAPGTGGVSVGAAQAFDAALAGALAERGLATGTAATFPGDGETVRRVRDAGGSLLIAPELVLTGNAVEIRIAMRDVRADTALPAVALRVPVSANDRAVWTSGAATWRDAPPGVRCLDERDAAGFLADFLPVRYHPGRVDAIYPDRIETLTLDARTPVAVFALDRVWPALVSTRWPVVDIVPVSTYYAPDRSESKVFYALCSNQRARTLTLLVDRTKPDSLEFMPGDGPRDTLSASVESCFARLDRVERPKPFRVPPGLPPTASTRFALAAVVTGPSGGAVTDTAGQVETRRMATVYYDPHSARVWIASADTSVLLPGRFGEAMEPYRAGRTGPAGFLLTSAAAPGEGDRLEYWVWRNGAAERRWRSPDLDVAITAVNALDLDGDGDEDIVYAGVRRDGAGFATRVRFLVSRPDLPEAP